MQLDEQNQRIKELEEEVRKDHLTGLLNRSGFLETANEQLKKEAETPTSNKAYVMFFLDADNFKAVNDTYGHDIGDNTLRSIADYLQGVNLRKQPSDSLLVDRRRKGSEPDELLVARGNVIYGNDPVARLGGDEFAILVAVDKQTDIDAFISLYKERVHKSHEEFLNQSDNAGLREVGLGISIGHAIWDGETSAEELLRKADESMYEDRGDSRR